MLGLSKPGKISGWQQLIIIVLSALPFWLGIYVVLPSIASSDGSMFSAYVLSLLPPLVLLLVAAFVVAKRQGGSLRERFGLKRLTGKDLLWTLGLLVLMVVSYLGLAPTSEWLLNNIPALAPPKEFDQLQTETSVFGVSLQGNWWALALHFGFLLFNIFGEELWFRGILFGKQKERYGKNAWLVHGLTYHLFHMFYPYDLFQLLPMSLAYGYVRQKTDNTWTTIIAHFVFNGIGMAPTIAGILQ